LALLALTVGAAAGFLKQRNLRPSATPKWFSSDRFRAAPTGAVEEA